MRQSRGFTLIELLIVIAIFGVLLSLSMAAYRHARVRGDEASAIAALDAINQAQFAYTQTCGRQLYAPSLASLGVAVPGGAPYLSPDLAQADPLTKSGYIIQMGGTESMDAPATCTGVRPITGYQVTADPAAPGVSGTRFFATNTERLIYEDLVSFAGSMPESGPPEHGAELRVRRQSP